MFDLIFFSALILILVGCAVIGFFRGFINSIAGFVKYIASFFIAKAFSPLLAKWIIKLPFIAKLITPGVETPAFEGSIVNQLLQMVKYITNAFTAEEGSELKQIANNYLAQLIANVSSFVVLFIVCVLLITLVFVILNRIAKIEGFKEINRFFGLLVGILIGLLLTWIISSIFVSFVLPILVQNYPDVVHESIKDNILMVIFTKYNPIALIMNALNF